MMCLATSFLKLTIFSVPKANPTARTPVVNPMRMVTRSLTRV